jgi:hypothetical protein
VTPSKQSYPPLWLTLGFVAGLGFGWFAFHERQPDVYLAPPLAVTAQAIPAVEREPEKSLRAVEEVFDTWGGYAVWEDGSTEIALWDPRLKRHAHYFEVRRHGGHFYFRRLRQLSRPLLDHGVSAQLPIHFTETQAMRDQFYRENPEYDPAAAPVVELAPRRPDRGLSHSAPRPPLIPGAGS